MKESFTIPTEWMPRHGEPLIDRIYRLNRGAEAETSRVLKPRLIRLDEDGAVRRRARGKRKFQTLWPWELM